MASGIDEIRVIPPTTPESEYDHVPTHYVCLREHGEAKEKQWQKVDDESELSKDEKEQLSLFKKIQGEHKREIYFWKHEKLWDVNASSSNDDGPERQKKKAVTDFLDAWVKRVENPEGPEFYGIDRWAIRDELPRRLSQLGLTACRLGAPGVPKELRGADLRRANLQGACLEKAQLQGADLVTAQLHGARLGRARLQGANLRRAQLQGADLEGAQLQGANLDKAQLQGANLEGAQLQGACLDLAQLQGARLVGAQFQGASLDGAQLQRANLLEAQLQGACLIGAQLHGACLQKAQLQGARLDGADLSEAKMEDADVTEVTMSGATWEKPPTRIDRLITSPMPVPRFSKKALPVGGKGFILRSLVFGPADDDDDDDNEDEDEDEDEDEGEQRDEAQQGDSQDQEGGKCECLCSAPLLCCEGQVQDAVDQGVRVLKADLQQVAEAALDDVENLSNTKMEPLVEKAKVHLKALKKASKRLDVMAEQRWQRFSAALKCMERTKKDFLEAAKRSASQKKKESLVEHFEKLAVALTEAETPGKLAAELDKLEDELRKDGASHLLARLLDGQLKATTGYSPSRYLRIFRASPQQMASDLRELTEIKSYLGKLQESVNTNNWDDVVDSFHCFYQLKRTLRGERSQQVFMMVWKDEELRKIISLGITFRSVKEINNPPLELVSQIKKAVKFIKDHDQTWSAAVDKEIAAVERTKSNQAESFAFLRTCLTGLFMYIATLFSGLTLDAIRSGSVEIPYLSNFTAFEHLDM